MLEGDAGKWAGVFVTAVFVTPIVVGMLVARMRRSGPRRDDSPAP